MESPQQRRDRRLRQLVGWVQAVVTEGYAESDMESVREILDQGAQYLRGCYKVELWLLRGDFRED